MQENLSKAFFLEDYVSGVNDFQISKKYLISHYKGVNMAVHRLNQGRVLSTLLVVLSLFLCSGLVLADTVAPDNYDFRVWQGTATSVTASLLAWTTTCDTNPASDADDGSGGYSCNLTVGTAASPTYYSAEGNIYSQMRAYHEPDVGQTYNYSYTTCSGTSNTSCNTYTYTDTVSGVYLYNINYDTDANDCNALNGATACGGESCYNTSWTFESGTGSCCGDDASEAYATQVFGTGMTGSSDNTKACCSVATDCVENSLCNATGSSFDADGNGDTDYCNAGTWIDCNSDSNCAAGYICSLNDCVNWTIGFVPPTPTNATTTTNTSMMANVSINNISNIMNMTWSWNSVNYTMYDNSSLVLMMNFDNVSTIGDSTTAVVDISKYGNNGSIAVATGGTITTILEGGKNYTVHTFTSDGTFTPSKAMNVEVLVVAGGGGGGSSVTASGGGGGGGAGGLIYSSSYAASASPISVVVGTGGSPGGAGLGQDGNNGTNSSFGTITAAGGGGGDMTLGTGGSSGGSGGGGGYNGYATPRAGGSGVAGQGNDGGATTDLSWAGGAGGGGAGGVGGVNLPSHVGGVGGTGLSYSINGTSVNYSKGGNGGQNSAAASPANTGKGGDAAYAAGTAYAGGSGIVIIRYSTALSYTTGKYGKAINFDGVDDYISIENSPSLTINKSQTICMWLYPIDFSARRNPYSKAYGGEGTITQELAGTLSYYYGTNGGDALPYQGFGSGTALTINTWNFACIVRDLVNMNLTWYINGQQNSAAASYSTATSGNQVTYIGKGYVPNYNGSIDELRIWNRSLSSDEILQHYRSNLNKYDTNMWRFVANESNLAKGTYNYYACAKDSSGAQKCTDTYYFGALNSSIRTMVGGPYYWTWSNDVKIGDIVKNGTSMGWEWMPFTATGMRIPNGSATNWQYINI